MLNRLPSRDPASSDLPARVEDAGRRTVRHLASLQAPGAPRGVMRISAAHDPDAWPGVLLPGTYNGLMCLDLLGALDLDAGERETLVDWIEGHRIEGGAFRIPGMTDANVFKKPDLAETWLYVDFHVTNYALGAIEALDPACQPDLSFAEKYLDPLVLKAFLADRDLRDPWQEGNNVVNLGGFLLRMAKDGDAAVRARVAAALAILFDWHDRNQNPATGFWGVGQSSDPVRLLHAMAGSMHNYHLWYAVGRPLPCQDKAVDYVLSRPAHVVSACIDVDEIDLLVHALAMIDHRRTDIRRWLAAKLEALLAFQNADGGFADEVTGVRRQDGWVGGYSEPQGLSNTFATWFRWIAIAMAFDALHPGARRWNFRRSVGIGYRMPPIQAGSAA